MPGLCGYRYCTACNYTDIGYIICRSLNLYFRSGTFSVTLKQRSSITWMKEVATRVKIQHKRSNDRWYFSGVHISLF